MVQPITILFVLFAALFALVHWLAVDVSLYWYYWWFDILMHFWGGVLIALGVATLSTFRRFAHVFTFKITFVIAILIVISWELFEWNAELIDPFFEWRDTMFDVVIGIIAALVGYYVLKRFKF